MNLFDYMISLNINDFEFNYFEFLHIYFVYEGKILLFKFDIFSPLSNDVSTNLKIELFKLFNVENFQVEVDLINNVINQKPKNGIVGEIIYLKGTLYALIELINVEFVRSLLRSKPYAGFKQGCYYFLNKINGKGYIGKFLNIGEQ